MKYKIKEHKNIMYLILLIFSIIIIVFTYNNYFLYKTTILEITNIENKYSMSDESIEQHIIGVIKNGDFKGNTISVRNYTSISGVLDEQLHNNSELLVKLSGDGKSVSEIIGVKRDKYLIILLIILIDLTIIIGGKKGIKSLICLFINVLLAIESIYLYINGKVKLSILSLFMILVFIFIVLSLLICNGKSKKTLAAILSSIVSVFISFLLSYIVLNYYNNSINFWFMDYIEIIKDYQGIFYTNILLCGLGAIMDISITMASSLYELISTNNDISVHELRKSGQEISKDILRTMINVMLFTCYISVIPIIILASKNYLSIFEAINTYAQIEMIRVLTSCISIVLAIPISLYISLLIYKGVKKHD